MLLTCRWLSEIMEGHAPTALALEYDNVGLLLGSEQGSLNKILVALDLTDAVVGEAIAEGVDMVLTHHPLIFRPINRITDETPLGRRITKLIKHDISVYAAHTNLDITEGGTNDVLADLLGLGERAALGAAESGVIGRVGVLAERQTLQELAVLLKERLRLPVIGVTGDASQSVRRVGLCTGSGSSPKFIAAAKAQGCDVYITGDVTYHNAQAAAELDIALLDATHYGTEIIIVKALKALLERKAAEAGASLTVLESKADARTLNYL